jgi:hypothetical protein
VRTYDFVHDQLATCGPLKMLCILDADTLECLTVEVGKSMRSQGVIVTLSRLIRVHFNGDESVSSRNMSILVDICDFSGQFYAPPPTTLNEVTGFTFMKWTG